RSGPADRQRHYLHPHPMKAGFTSLSSSTSSPAPSSAGNRPNPWTPVSSPRRYRRALDTGMVASGALFHSDRGCQYTAGVTRDLLNRAGLLQSMSAAGYCYDNAFAESAFASIKTELLEEGRPFPSKEAASTAVFDYMETFYNRKRLHGSL